MVAEFALTMLMSIVGTAECTGVISGYVVDSSNQSPLSGVSIAFADKGTQAVTNSEGYFKAEKLCTETVELRLTTEAYQKRSLSIKMGLNQILSLDPLNKEEIEEFVIRGQQTRATETRSISSLDTDSIRRSGGKNLADTLAELPGVSVLRSGNVAKPIVRGQHSSRLLMLFDGVRHEGQDWGMSHGVEIDPFSAGSMDVVKGSAGVRYGPDAIAGVLIVNPPTMLDEPGVRVETLTVGALNGRRGTMAGRIEGNSLNLPELSLRLQGNYSRGAGIETPTYPLDNTGIEEWNTGGAMSYEGDCWNLELSFHRKAEKSGVCRCVRKETTDDFDAQVLQDEPPLVELYQSDYEIERPYQGVIHDIAIARASVDIDGFGQLEGTYAFQSNDRKEYEIVRVETDAAQHNFVLRTHTADALLRQTPIRISDDLKLEGLFGISGMLQENVYRGWPLLSDFRAFSGGVFGLERLKWDNYELEFGARFDHTTRNAYLPKKTYQSLAREDRINPDECNLGDDFTRCDRTFNAATFSLGGLIHLSQGIFAKVDLSSATRAPTIDEQYLNGTSPSFPVMARGNHTLDSETSWSSSATLEAETSFFSGELSAYGSYIDDYIYLAPELREDGTIRTDVLIQGRFPRFSYDPIDAIFYGAEADTVVRLGPLDIGIQASMVRARNAKTDEFLLFIPPDEVSTKLTYQLPDTDWMEDSQVSLDATIVARQYSVSPDSDFAPVPDAYPLYGASASTKLYIGEARYLLSLEVQNILNSRYRDYTSLLRYFADEPGRQVYLRFGTEFGPERY